MDLKAFTAAISQISEEKGIPEEVILETIETAIAAAYKKDYGKRGQIIRAKLDKETGELKLWQIKIVVDESMIRPEEEFAEGEEAGHVEGPGDSHAGPPASREFRRAEPELEDFGEEDGEKKVRFNPEKHIMVDEAKEIKKRVKPGDELVFDLETKEDFGRIAAQTAKQVILQRIREAEREAILSEFQDKQDQVISGIVQRVEGKTVFFDIGKTTGIMLARDQIPYESYRMGQRFRIYVVEAQIGPKGPQVYLSRSHPKMLSRLFELEVPEIATESIVIKSVAREPGERSKIAVEATQEGIDPIGSMVGQRGTRVSAVINELGGEKIDIIEWNEDVEKFIANSLSPAKVLVVEVEKNRAVVTVADDQLSLAIGKGGQNVRLAAKLTGWKIDIKSRETGDIKESAEEKKTDAAKEKPKKAAPKRGPASTSESEAGEPRPGESGREKKEKEDSSDKPKTKKKKTKKTTKKTEEKIQE